MPSLEIYQLNHASLLLVMGGVRLLTDPWFEGTAFNEGWALRWQNPEAYKLAATATHLWISHPHSDHLNHSTLECLRALNPDMAVLANHGYTYSLEKQMRSLGFRSVLAFQEGRLMALDGECTVQRIGSGIIDSMLVIRWRDQVLLNLNDCVLQKSTLRHIAGQIGKIDLLLCNFNHAGKLLHYPEQAPEQVRGALQRHYRMQAGALQPRCVLPFASFHRYLSPLSLQQNHSLLEPSDLETATSGIAKTVALYPGQCACLDFSAPNIGVSVTGAPSAANDETVRTDSSAPEKGLAEAVTTFEQRLHRSFGPLRILLPGIAVRVLETQEIVRIHRGRVRTSAAHILPDMEAPREKILHWFSNPFGTDAFVIGAHFRILRPCIGRLKLLIALLLLAEARISPRHMCNLRLWGFLLRRRHEAVAALFSWRVSSSYQ